MHEELTVAEDTHSTATWECGRQRAARVLAIMEAPESEQRVVYLSPAANSAGTVWSCPCDVNGTILTTHLGFPRLGVGRLLCP